MMREGTTTKSSQQISQALETMSANVNVFSGASGPTATVSGNALTENFPRLFELAADVLLNPSFPSGCVLTDEEWSEVARHCVERDLWLLYWALMEGIVFDGAQAAVARINLDGEPPPELLQAVRDGNADVLDLQLVSLSHPS